MRGRPDALEVSPTSASCRTHAQAPRAWLEGKAPQRESVETAAGGGDGDSRRACSAAFRMRWPLQPMSGRWRIGAVGSDCASRMKVEDGVRGGGVCVAAGADECAARCAANGTRAAALRGLCARIWAELRLGLRCFSKPFVLGRPGDGGHARLLTANAGRRALDVGGAAAREIFSRAADPIFGHAARRAAALPPAEGSLRGGAAIAEPSRGSPAGCIPKRGWHARG